MLQTFGPANWVFARVEAPLTECSDKLSLLLRSLKKRSQASADALSGLQCLKASRDSWVRFHKINTARSSHCLMHVLQDFSMAESRQLAECCEIARRHGYGLTLIWEQSGIIGEWSTSEGAQPPRVGWEQYLTDGALDKALWKDLWSFAAESLGLTGRLQETEREGLSMPEFQDGGPSQVRVDPGGARVVVKANGSQLKFGLSEIQSATVESMKTNGVAATNRLMGEPVVQLFRMMYGGKELITTQRLNQLLPICHSVSYMLNDNERDRYYPGIFKPLEMNVGEVLALPVIELEGENAGQAEAVFVVNLVRTKDDSWLEFQVKAPLVLFDWLEDTLGCKLDCWSGPVESRWGWYPLDDHSC